MHTTIPVFTKKLVEPDTVNINDVLFEDEIFNWLKDNFGADYCSTFVYSYSQFIKESKLKKFLAGNNVFIFTDENLKPSRDKCANFIKDALEKIDYADEISSNDWSEFRFNVKHPNWWNEPEVIILDENYSVYQVCYLSDLDIFDDKLEVSYIGMIDYHS